MAGYNNFMIDKILRDQPLISDQINSKQLRVILSELEKQIQSNVSCAVVEFGCYAGTTSLFIRRMLDAYGDSREFHVYDSFTGLPAKSDADSSPIGAQFQFGELAVSKKQFVFNFKKAGLALPYIHKGWFGDLSAADVPAEISLAFLDGDFYGSIKDSLVLVGSKMTSGGVIIVDDYANEALPGAAKACHEYYPPERISVIHGLGIIRI